MSEIEFYARIPKSGFFWVIREEDGCYKIFEPPEDWPESFYSHEYSDESHDSYAERIFIACSNSEFWDDGNHVLEHGRIISKPDIYLEFMNTRLTPATIIEFANSYGFLKHFGEFEEHPKETAGLFISKLKNPDIASRIPSELFFKRENGEEETAILIEPAMHWIKTSDHMRVRASWWANFKNSAENERKRDFFNESFNWHSDRSLTFTLYPDPETGKAMSKVLANGFENAMFVQWGIAIAGGADFSYCESCNSLILIAPGKGRPEKKYCSSACSMQAYRKRKKSAQSKKKDNG